MFVVAPVSLHRLVAADEQGALAHHFLKLFTLGFIHKPDDKEDRDDCRNGVEAVGSSYLCHPRILARAVQRFGGGRRIPQRYRWNYFGVPI